MTNPTIHEETICAVSSAPGQGGVALIRISGPDAIAICDPVFRPVRKEKTLSTQPNYTLTYGSIFRNEERIDEVLVAVFRNPHSFTGEETVEITCHGSLYIQQQILQLLIENGCRSALPGEFTQRAFMNGKMDLSQAEAVADLIASSSAAAHKLALSQMRGGFSNELNKLRSRLLDFVSLVELELDFSEEEVEFADRERLKELSTEIETIISRLANSFSVGNAIKNGVPVAIVGETNAGKSTLLNHLLQEEKAIVSNIHGTTRDVIEDTINMGGITFRFIDTAGIRETLDVIESLGIERTFQKIEQAEIVIWMIDATSQKCTIVDLSQKVLPLTKEKQLIVVFNKSDLIDDFMREELTAIFPTLQPVFISAKNDFQTDILCQRLIEAAHLPEISQNDVIVTNLRHYEALVNALAAIQRANEGLLAGISGDFLSQDIRECMHYLGEITGQITPDDILGSIFSKFCIGK